ncbi:DNA glycosylase [Massarina eburnea CBS 473.64]|uniref:DNA glycosylase n=1 Tax=Massarina eburnea CBS 473.64 TaxID=1395130 RepID=A0A6A6RSK1_9PLEO|nr:DNA glycosylase [Massarina eburnea CBS 473.64]
MPPKCTTEPSKDPKARMPACASASIEPPDPTSTPPPPSFKGQLAKYEYTLASSPSRKRTRAAVTAAAAAPSGNAHSSSPRPNKKRKPSKYADPSKYAHLSPLVDILKPKLICVFVGTNPGVQTATAGHAYAHPSNHFWKLLHSSGLTDRRLKPEEDRSLPALYCMGNTNIVERPSKDAAELSRDEMTAGAAVLDEKFREYKPEAVCIVGKGIWEAIWRWKYGKNPSKAEFRYGWQDEGHNMGRSVEGEEEVAWDGGTWRGSRVFVATSTSGLAASLKPTEKEAIWKPFGEWVQRRRAERGFVPGDDSAEAVIDNTPLHRQCHGSSYRQHTPAPAVPRMASPSPTQAGYRH